jgi:acyl-homoserine lactone acylase PvdQ
VLQPGPQGKDSYLTAGGPRAVESETETIEVAGGTPQELVVRRTVWGPIVGDDGEAANSRWPGPRIATAPTT